MWRGSAVFLLLWQLAAMALDSAFLPPLGEVFRAFADSFIFERIWSDVVPSIGRMAAGYALAAAVGVGAGLVIGSNWVVRRTTGPVTEFLRAIPPPALLPFAMLVFGFGLSMKVFVIAIGCVWPILLNTVDGVRGADPMFNEVARVYRLDSRSRLRRVVIPAAAPQIAVGLRASLSIALILMVISEMVASTNGLGYFVLQAQRTFRLDDMWAGILMLGIVGFALNAALRRSGKTCPRLAPRDACRERCERRADGSGWRPDARDEPSPGGLRVGERCSGGDRRSHALGGGGRVRVCRRTFGMRQEHHAALSCRADVPDVRGGHSRRRADRRSSRADGFGLPAVRAVPVPVDDGSGKRGYHHSGPRVCRPQTGRAWSRRRSARWGWRIRSTATRGNCPAECSKGWRLPVLWPTSRKSS